MLLVNLTLSDLLSVERYRWCSVHKKNKMWWLISDPDRRRLERCDVRWHHGVRRALLFWDDRVLLLHHPLHLWKLYPASLTQTYFNCWNSKSMSTYMSISCMRIYEAVFELSFTQHIAQISSWMSSWLSLWTTWQMQSRSTRTKETRKGDTWIVNNLSRRQICTDVWLNITHNNIHVRYRDKKEEVKDEKVSFVWIIR